MESQELNIDERWYIKINNNVCVSECKIKEVTEKTILLEFEAILRNEHRYEKSDIKFIEKIK